LAFSSDRLLWQVLFDLTGTYAMPFELVIAINLVAAVASFACSVPPAMLHNAAKRGNQYGAGGAV
jgi:hypothetical protein